MYLLDTNALIIFLHDELTNAELSDRARNILLSEDALYISIASLWEIAIKVKIGKLRMNKSIKEIEEECRRQNIEIISIKTSYLDKMLDIPLLQDHKDPFDRLIMATAIVDNMTLISTDFKMRRKEYGVNVIY